MCRLFGFRSIIESKVHSSLMNAENALGIQSVDHPDGWGVAYYIGPSPHLIKADRPAIECEIFKKVSGVVSSHTVLAHIRKSTIGQKNVLNTHPFQFGQWVFAHNGNIKDFDNKKEQLLGLVADEYKNFILGSTDSELFFFIILSQIKKFRPLGDPMMSIDVIYKGVKKAVSAIIDICGECGNNEDPDTETFLTFILSNGRSMMAHHGGKNLYFSTHKKKCDESDSCDFYDNSCENPSESEQKVNHLILSSEPLQGENIWNSMNKGQFIAVGPQMQLKIFE